MRCWGSRPAFHAAAYLNNGANLSGEDSSLLFAELRPAAERGAFPQEDAPLTNPAQASDCRTR